MLLLGVDGGGTKTTAWLARAEGDSQPEVIGIAAAGPANPRAVGHEAAQTAIQSAIDDAFRDANLAPIEVAASVLAIAGAAEVDTHDHLQRWADEQRLAGRVTVVSDAEPLLAVGTPSGWGVALVAGTGSYAVGRSPDSCTASSGGFGYLFGDEGSGYWLGSRALQAVARMVDGRGPRTELADAVAANLGAREPREIKSAVYAAADPRRVIASLSSAVFRAADAGDAVATDLVAEGAGELAALVRATTERLGLENCSVPLAFAGGVVVGSQRYRERICENTTTLGLTMAPITVVAEPVAGCVALAIKLARE